MIRSFLISLGESVPVLSAGILILVSPDEGFPSVNSDNFDDFSPLVDDISFLIPFDNCGLNMVEVVDPILHIQVVIYLKFLRIHHLILRHFPWKKLYFKLECIYFMRIALFDK